MRIIIYGAGGIGGVIGARLSQNGYEVILIARGAHLDAIQQKGLRFESPHESVALQIPAVGHPSEIEFQAEDVVLMTMKSQHSLSALEDLRAAAGEEISVICCQNGVENERMALRRFNRVYAMVVYIPTNHLEPGVVQAQSKTLTGILDAGVYPRGTDALIEKITAMLEASNFSAKADPRVMRWKYTKLLMNLGNSLQAACAPDPDETREIRELLRREALSCYEAAGIEYATVEEERERRGTLIQLGEINGRKRLGGSSWQSLTRGTGNIEADYLNGEIVLLGRLHGIPTPANHVLQKMADKIARERTPAGSVPLDDVKESIKTATRFSFNG